MKRAATCLILAGVLFALTLGCPSKKEAPEPRDWAYGTWVSEKISRNLAEKQQVPLEKHAMVFEKNGDIKRIDNNNSMSRLVMDFRMTGTLLEMAPMDTGNFMVYGKIRPDGTLKMFVTQDGYYIYRKLEKPLTQADLDGEPVIDTP